MFVYPSIEKNRSFVDFVTVKCVLALFLENHCQNRATLNKHIDSVFLDVNTSFVTSILFQTRVIEKNIESYKIEERDSLVHKSSSEGNDLLKR